MHPCIVYSDSGSRGFHGLQCHGIHNKQTLRLHIEAGAKSQFMILFSRHPDPATGNAPVFAVVERGDSIPARMVGPVGSRLVPDPSAWVPARCRKLLKALWLPTRLRTGRGPGSSSSDPGGKAPFVKPTKGGLYAALKCTTFNASAASFGANG
jgi:hypothetical protein